MIQALELECESVPVQLITPCPVPLTNHGALDAKLNCLAVQRSDVLTSRSCRIALTRLKTSRSALVLLLAGPGYRSAQAWARHAQGLEPRKRRFRRPGDHSVPTQDMRHAWRLQRNGSRSSGSMLLVRPAMEARARFLWSYGDGQRWSHQTRPLQALAAPGARGTVSRHPSMLTTRFRGRGKGIWNSS